MEDVVAILAFGLGLPAILMSGLVRLRRMRLESRALTSGEGLRVSELKRIVREAVEEANAPLRARVEGLEAIATDDDDLRPRAYARPAIGESWTEEPALGEAVAARPRSRA